MDNRGQPVAIGSSIVPHMVPCTCCHPMVGAGDGDRWNPSSLQFVKYTRRRGLHRRRARLAHHNALWSHRFGSRCWLCSASTRTVRCPRCHRRRLHRYRFLLRIPATFRLRSTWHAHISPHRALCSSSTGSPYGIDTASPLPCELRAWGWV